MSIADYFQQNENLRVETLSEQKLVRGDMELSKRLDQAGELLEIQEGDAFIQQGDNSKSIYFILSGTTEIVVNGRKVATRGPSDHVGEMAVIQPTQLRSATCIAAEQQLVLRVKGEDFNNISEEFPKIYQPLAKEMAKRLLERNNSMPGHRENVRVFIICSVEALDIARTIQNAFEHDPFNVTVWTDGVFKIATYPVEALEAELENSDFALAIAHADDRTLSRDVEWPSPRDNVIFELGLFLGRLGRSRAILMEPRDGEIKLPSDLSGITTIPYSFPDEKNDVASAMAPACNRLRDHIQSLGPYNG
ncbi:nucleotide-binding protein [Pontixanthobacter aestiaquae]|uniref:Cyclic nucleotide-binding domain-containing protein n=1 Tax=Pontixanthobacter aestiaquae TaxID=1509367 RepID=A0A844ZDR1_9SPHN|nr:TIR domain-containing protein [Pontixanthobacter aestiaquae]MDN3645081.1 nucleotide-binding protein [Pontixanthobacter aestiaquae]MXO83919.1 cyclic nucleotide-binding domain-containing protein [Pontixanthobacter aestiaquae]